MQEFLCVGDSGWIAVVKGQYGNVLKRYVYAKGRIFHRDTTALDYYRYDWHGNNVRSLSGTVLAGQVGRTSVPGATRIFTAIKAIIRGTLHGDISMVR